MKQANGRAGGRAIGTALLVAGVFGSSVAGQQIPQQLTLEEAQRLSRLYNPEYRQVQNNADVAAAQLRNRYASFLPTLRTTPISFGGSHSWRRQAVDEFNRPINEPRTVESEGSDAGQSASLSLMLFDGGASFRNVALARANQRASDAGIADRGNALRAEVARNYYAALRAQRSIELEAQLLAARKADLESTEKHFRVAARKHIDVLSMRVQVASAEQSLDLARGNAEKARIALKQTLGLEGAPEFSLTSEPPITFDPTTLNADALVQRALAGSPLVLAAEANVNMADKSASIARSARLPQISGSMSFSRGSSARGYDAIGNFDMPNRAFSFSIGVSLPLFSQFSTSTNIAQADANEQDRREDLRRVRLQVEGNVRSAIIDLNNAYRTVQLAQSKADLSREQLAMAQEEYRIGASGMDFFRLQQIVNEEATAQRQLLEARFTFATALIALEERLGGPLER